MLFGVPDQIQAEVDDYIFLLIGDQNLSLKFIEFEGHRRPVTELHKGEIYLTSRLNVSDFVLFEIFQIIFIFFKY